MYLLDSGLHSRPFYMLQHMRCRINSFTIYGTFISRTTSSGAAWRTLRGRDLRPGLRGAVSHWANAHGFAVFPRQLRIGLQRSVQGSKPPLLQAAELLCRLQRLSPIFSPPTSRMHRAVKNAFYGLWSAGSTAAEPFPLASTCGWRVDLKHLNPPFI